MSAFPKWTCPIFVLVVLLREVQAVRYVIDLSSLVYIRTAGFDLSPSTLTRASCRSTH